MANPTHNALHRILSALSVDALSRATLDPIAAVRAGLFDTWPKDVTLPMLAEVRKLGHRLLCNRRAADVEAKLRARTASVRYHDIAAGARIIIVALENATDAVCNGVDAGKAGEADILALDAYTIERDRPGADFRNRISRMLSDRVIVNETRRDALDFLLRETNPRDERARIIRFAYDHLSPADQREFAARSAEFAHETLKAFARETEIRGDIGLVGYAERSIADVSRWLSNRLRESTPSTGDGLIEVSEILNDDAFRMFKRLGDACNAAMSQAILGESDIDSKTGNRMLAAAPIHTAIAREVYEPSRDGIQPASRVPKVVRRDILNQTKRTEHLVSQEIYPSVDRRPEATEKWTNMGDFIRPTKELEAHDRPLEVHSTKRRRGAPAATVIANQPMEYQVMNAVEPEAKPKPLGPEVVAKCDCGKCFCVPIGEVDPKEHRCSHRFRFDLALGRRGVFVCIGCTLEVPIEALLDANVDPQKRYSSTGLDIADRNGILHDENRALLVDNARLRRRLEAAERKKR